MAKVESKDAAVRRQLNELPVAGQSTIEMLPKSQSSTFGSLDGVQTRVKGSRLNAIKTFVPVLSYERKPLMPTTPSRARRWIKSGKATPFWNRGVFCVRLNQESGTEIQTIACGIDPGSKLEGYTVKSKAHTFLNIQAGAITWVKFALSTRRLMRDGRRYRKTPHRAKRINRKQGVFSPSIKARWQWKLRVAKWLCGMFPIYCFVVEEVKARHKKNRGVKDRIWNSNFSYVELGKNDFYKNLSKLGFIETKEGRETSELRYFSNLNKSKGKKPSFYSHCVDSWVLANWFVEGPLEPDNTSFIQVYPIHWWRRRLHTLQPSKRGTRRMFGGTRSLGFKKGSIVRHEKYGVVYIGGNSSRGLSLHSMIDECRIARTAKPQDCKFLAFSSWRTIPYSLKDETPHSYK